MSQITLSSRSLSRVEIEQRSREARLRLEQLERLLAAPAVTQYRYRRSLPAGAGRYIRVPSLRREGRRPGDHQRVLTLGLSFGRREVHCGWLGTPIMKGLVICILCLVASGTARANEPAQCRANAGTYLTGKVIKGPTFAPGHPRNGVELSHTHLRLLSDQDGRAYDVAIDNVFATGYDAAGESVPALLSTIRAGDRLELCGRPFFHGGRGIDWVHTNCGARPSAAQPNGWLKVLRSDGTPGPNLENSEEYCRLWR